MRNISDIDFKRARERRKMNGHRTRPLDTTFAWRRFVLVVGISERETNGRGSRRQRECVLIYDSSVFRAATTRNRVCHFVVGVSDESDRRFRCRNGVTAPPTLRAKNNPKSRCCWRVYISDFRCTTRPYHIVSHSARLVSTGRENAARTPAVRP